MERFINKLLGRNLCFIGKANEVEEVIKMNAIQVNFKSVNIGDDIFEILNLILNNLYWIDFMLGDLRIKRLCRSQKVIELFESST